MLSSAHVAFHSTDFILVRLLCIAGDFLPLLQSLLKRKRGSHGHGGRIDLGDLAFGRHDGAAVLGAIGRSYGQARAVARASHSRYRRGLLCRRGRERLLGHRRWLLVNPKQPGQSFGIIVVRGFLRPHHWRDKLLVAFPEPGHE